MMSALGHYQIFGGLGVLFVRQFVFEKRAEWSPLYTTLFNYVFVILYTQNVFLFLNYAGMREKQSSQV